MKNLLLHIRRWTARLTDHPVIMVVAGLGVLVMLVPVPALAGIGSFFGTIFFFIASFLAHLTLTLIGLLVDVVQYNDFIYAPAVVKGWVVMRDVVNMFFIVVLLVIAFGTVFRMEEYQYNHVLGKLLTMAVLVNFSKSIAGFFIDFAQVVMLTFVNGFKDAAAGNFISGFHLDKMFQFATQANPAQAQDESMFFYASLLSLVLIAVTTAVVGVYLIIFLLRIVALWFLVIISPLAFLANAWPGKGHEYHEEWWDYFGKYASTGPILAFFLWLSLAVMQFSTDSLKGFSAGNTELSIPAAAVTGIGQSDILLSFIISIIMLIGGLWMASHLGVAGGKLAAGTLHSIQRVGARAAKGTIMAPFRTYAWAARKAGAGKVPGLRWLKGYELNPAKIWKNLKLGMETKKQKEEHEIEAGAAANIRRGGLRGLTASLATPDIGDNLQGFLYLKTLRGIFTNAKSIEQLDRRHEKLRERSTQENYTVDTTLDRVRKGKALGNAPMQAKVTQAITRIDGGEDKTKVMREVFTNNELTTLHNMGKRFIQEDITSTEEEIERLKRSRDPADRQKVAALENRRVELGVQLGTELLTPEARAQLIEEVDTIGNRIKRMRGYLPENYYAMAALRETVSKEKSKIPTTNEDELISQFHDALARHDAALGQAIVARATEVGHLNELVQEFNLPSSIDGLHKFIRDVMMRGFHMREQEALAFENDLSNKAEEIGWWTYGQATTVKNGQFLQREREEQKARTYVEMGKRDLRNAWRQWNRGAWMDEDWKDSKDHSQGRYAILNETGIAFIRSKYAELQEHIKEINPNTLENLNSEANMKVLATIGNDIAREAAELTSKGMGVIAEQQTNAWDEFMKKLRGKIADIPSKKGGISAGKAIASAAEIRNIAGAKITISDAHGHH